METPAAVTPVKAGAPLPPAPDTGEPASGALRPGAVVGGAAFTLIANYGASLVNLSVTVVLAHNLGPTGMGVVAAALLTVEMIDTVRNLGLREALIYEPDLDRRYFNAAFLVILAVALLQALCMVAAGIAGAALGMEPRLAHLLPWLALIFPLTALGTPQEAMLARQGRFIRRASAELLNVAVKAVVAIALIELGWGIAGLVAGMLAGVVARAVYLWVRSTWRPALRRPAAEVLLTLYRYGRHIVFVNLLSLLRAKADQYLVAALLMPSALGTYYLAARIPEMAIFAANVSITNVVFPTFAHIAREGGRAGRPEDLGAAYIRAIRAAMLLMVPVSLGIAATSLPIVEVLFGARFDQAAPILAVLALGGIPLTLGWSSGDVFKATGRPHLLTAVTLIEVGLAIPVLALAILFIHDLRWVAAAMVACETASCLVRLRFMARYEGVGIGETLRAVAPSLLAGVLMAALVLGAGLHLQPLAPALRLALLIALGAAVYAGLILALDRGSVAELRLLLRRVPPAPGAPPAPDAPAAQG